MTGAIGCSTAWPMNLSWNVSRMAIAVALRAGQVERSKSGNGWTDVCRAALSTKTARKNYEEKAI